MLKGIFGEDSETAVPEQFRKNVELPAPVKEAVTNGQPKAMPLAV